MKAQVRHSLLALAAVLIAAVLITGVSLSRRRQQPVCGDFVILIADSLNRQYVSTDELRQYVFSHGFDPRGQEASMVNTDTIEHLLRQHSMVRSAQCYKSPSGTVYARVRQRVPRLRVAGAENYYVDTEGQVMPTAHCAAYVPVVTGRVTREMATGPLLQFVGFLEDHRFWNNQVEQINITLGGHVELVMRVGSAIVLLGSLDQYEHKLNKLYTLYQRGFRQTGWPACKTIDLQYNNQIVCTQ